MEVTVDLDDQKLLQKLGIICDLIFGKSDVKAKERAVRNKTQVTLPSTKRFYFNTQDILKILRGCLVSHRFSPALQILENISAKVAVRTHGIYVKNSLFVMEHLQQEQETAKESMEFFVRHVTVLSEVHKRELVLEYLLCRVRNHQFENPADVIQNVLFAGLCLRKNKIIDPILESYITLLDYIAWQKNVHLSSGSDSQFLEEAQNISEKIIFTWSSIISQPGIWDIFLEKLIQVLLGRGDHECCDQVLKSYVESHPDHLNAHIYLTLYAQNVSKNERLKNLKKIAHMSPSDEVVLDYVDILLAEQEIAPALKCIFQFLDYSTNKQCLRGWTTLVKIVYSILLSHEHKAIITLRHMWKERYDFWIKYHFDETQEDFKNESQPKLCEKKCIFLCMILRSNEHIFIETTFQNIEVLYPKRLKKFRRKLKTIEEINKFQFYCYSYILFPTCIAGTVNSH